MNNKDIKSHNKHRIVKSLESQYFVEVGYIEKKDGGGA